ncbi:hypothetical protein [Qipengyuania aquimaris]|uniref:hypothetical protein n=1 Tax=Qipengyuania aquimaris TaxID=255984 RepID=UPI001FD5D924|nr:hypothetical protein [Qipengyuania aquimaris]UOR15525.1 hypothetical protein LCM05_00340 [Qipengyuania aquimaris]
MYTRIRIPFVALVLAAPAALSAQSVQEFQLPPNPTPTPSPNVQGPVDADGNAVPMRPRVIATPTPTPRQTPAPTPTPTSTQPAMVQPLPEATNVPARQAGTQSAPVRRPVETPAPQILPAPQQDLVPEATATPVPGLPADTTEQSTGNSPVTEGASTTPTLAADESASGEQPAWLWPAVGGGLLALLGLGYLFSRRRSQAEPPQIERPVVAPAAGAASAGPDIRISAEAIKLTRSVMNATLHYRVNVLNRSGTAAGGLTLGADVVSAHGGVPVEQQVASPDQTLEQRHTFERIAPGQSVRYEGQIIIPLSQARIIRQGTASLFVPLLRVRLDGAGEGPLVKTFVIGQGVPDGGRVSPFRLDDGPRSYQPIAARALD